ncbi:uncharacterized protein J4E79_005319 [Alternaria viburni]|uniref:uncharacterized protein n=1 Tax=Alternaria viburni TaxID=566460 RepID=UPI0020C4BAE0|nr:uncharacterized protein J4E79_005319 [Alternaria viburni]KAI4660751.1 hypothetical protein J4E79_005319 [Alternaria viburni]
MASNNRDDAQAAENIPIEPIVKALQEILSHSTYACGGSLNSPITIRWDSSTATEKLTLPLQVDSKGTVDKSLAKLLEGTEPAGFGYKGKDIIDESYRKASKLDTSAFSTNFCPYETGIIDVVAQALLPLSPDQSQGVRAELYKLNVYGAPSGLFKPHVDTPRSEMQFGSLVVCLPCAHEGGQLVVRHKGHTTTFDWSGDANVAQWAAFYSDCEHEVLEVTAGHRITLTYNLFVRRGLGELAGHADALDFKQLPLYREVANALNSPEFMAKGGYLGKYCDHAYAHATKEGSKALPALLKGSDFMAYEVFRSLGIKTRVRPVLLTSGEDEEDEEDDRSENRTDEDDDQKHLQFARIGKKLSAPVMSSVGGDEDDTWSEIYAQYPHDRLHVRWLNRHTTTNLQFGFLAYGNMADINYSYSSCALIFEIPTYQERCKNNLVK